MTMYITKKQKRILEYLKSYKRTHGVTPTYEEIANYFGYRSKGTVHKHICNLEEKGLIRKDWNKSRSIELMDRSEDGPSTKLQLRGRVAAGEPIEAIENPEAIDVPANMVGNGDHYVLQVQGNSMIDENIQDGDYVIVQPRETAGDGDMVVALLDDGEATLKTFYRDGDQIRLQPANADMSPLYVNPDQVRIRGVVIGVMRKF